MNKINVSNLLRVVYFVAAICIVAIHANTIHVVSSPSAWNIKFHNIVCHRFTFWAVPFFFIMSGFFFVRGRYVREDEGYFEFLSGKIKSIAIPYFLWSVVAAIILVPVVVANNFYAHRDLLERTFLESGEVFKSISALFGIGVWGGPCHNGPLWFLRSLMLLFVFAPLFRVLSRCRMGTWLLVVVFVILLVWDEPKIMYGYDWEYFLLGIVLGRCLPASILECHNGQLLVTIPHFMHLSFWLFCTHDIILGWVLGAGHFIFGKSNIAIACLTVIAIPLTVVVALGLAWLCYKFFPKVFVMLNGGRNFR